MRTSFRFQLLRAGSACGVIFVSIWLYPVPPCTRAVDAQGRNTKPETNANANIGTTHRCLSFPSFTSYANMASSSSSSSPEIHHAHSHNTLPTAFSFQCATEGEVLEELSKCARFSVSSDTICLTGIRLS